MPKKDKFIELLNFRAEIIKLEIKSKPSPLNHPFRNPIIQWKRTEDKTIIRNLKWLNNWKSEQEETIMWSKTLYSIEKQEEYGYNVDEDAHKENKARYIEYYA